jgi:competence protein ComGC
MVCSKCGAKLAAPSQFCPNCGETLTPVQAETQNDGNRPETDPKAAVSMVLGVLSILLSVFAGIPAVIFGHLSRASIRRSMGQLKGDGMAMAGLITGYISLFLLPFVAGIVFVAVPNVFRTKIVANESSVISTLKTIHVAAASYQVEHDGFPASLQELGQESLVPLDSQLAATGVQSGYQFAYRPTASKKGYVIHADPVFIHTGQRHFFMDETGVIRFENDRTAGAASKEAGP